MKRRLIQPELIQDLLNIQPPFEFWGNRPETVDVFMEFVACMGGQGAKVDLNLMLLLDTATIDDSLTGRA